MHFAILLSTLSLATGIAASVKQRGQPGLSPRSAPPPPNSAPPPPSGPASPSGPAPLSSNAPPPPGDPLITIGGHSAGGSFVGGATLAANSEGAYIISAQTLSRGAVVTEKGTTYSLVPSGTALVVDGRTSRIDQGAGSRIPDFSLSASASSSVAYKSSAPASSTYSASSSHGSSIPTSAASNGGASTPATAASSTPASSMASSTTGSGAATHALPNILHLSSGLCVVALTLLNWIF